MGKTGSRFLYKRTFIFPFLTDENGRSTETTWGGHNKKTPQDK